MRSLHERGARGAASKRPAPFIKWAGGKAQLLSELVNSAPTAFGSYFEPFVGGGALFFALAAANRIKDATLNDSNPDLVNAYRVIQQNLPELRLRISEMAEAYERCESKEAYYYFIRRSVPIDDTYAAARFIFLNKTGYNGLYRVNRQGEFNVPFGRHKKPTIYDAQTLEQDARVLIGVRLLRGHFRDALDGTKPGDFIYFDPPYQPISRTANFTSYTAQRFTTDDQIELAKTFSRLAHSGILVMLSNSDHSLIAELYSDKRYHLREVKANRNINSDPSKRGAITELLVTNY